MKILLIAGIALFIFGVKAITEFQGFRTSSVKVWAEVLESSKPTKEMRLPREGRVTVRYEYNGKIFQSSNTAHDTFWQTLKAGDRVELVLNEKEPSKFIPAHQLPKGAYLGYMLIAAGAIVFILGLLKR